MHSAKSETRTLASDEYWSAALAPRVIHHTSNTRGQCGVAMAVQELR